MPFRRFKLDADSWGPVEWMTLIQLLAGAVILGIMAYVFLFTTKRVRAAETLQESAAEEAKIEFGRHVFFDQGIYGASVRMSCATCHNPDPRLGYSNGQRIAVGGVVNGNTPRGPLGQRNVRSLVNCYQRLKSYTNHDGRTIGLSGACLQAVADPLVLGSSIADTVARINTREYANRLGRLAYTQSGVTESQLRECLVKFVCTIRSDDTYLDRLAHGEKLDLPEQLERGWSAFQKHNCMSCHQPDHNWEDGKFHDLGVSQRSQSTDTGRQAVTLNPADRHKFLTPSLIECAKTLPLGHDGSFPTILSIVQYKLRGGRYMLTSGQVVMARTLDTEIAEIRGTEQEADDIAALLEVCSQSPGYREVKNPHVAEGK